MTSKQYKISDTEFWRKINSDFNIGGGTYQLYCVDDIDNPIQINRLLKNDKKGILYIGKALTFLDRVIDLKKSLSPYHISANHECGVRYKNNLRERFPYENLWVELESFENIDEAEKKLLSDYENEFGELPPLNRNK